VPVEDLRRRAAYQALCDGAHASGRHGLVVFAVYTVDLDEGRGDVYVAAGLGLALVELGYGVRLIDRDHWHLIDEADVFVAMLPQVDPSYAPLGSWKVAWVRNETERWADSRHLLAYDQVIASSELSLKRLSRSTSSTHGLLPIGADTQLFSAPAVPHERSMTAVTTAHYWGSPRDVHRALMELPDDADMAWFGQSRGAPDKLSRWHRRQVPYFALPDIYRHSSVVIDDMNLTTVGYGSVNSRFFESAACGSLPVVNGILGTTALGFDSVPRYRSPEELVHILTSVRRDPIELGERARALQEEVEKRHSWSDRASRFVELMTEGRSAAPNNQPPTRALHFFPDWSKGNPYQAMLYSTLEEAGAYPIAVDNLPDHLRRQNESPGKPGCLHVHWTSPILQRARGPYRASLVLQRLTEELERFKSRGGRLIWTIHNLLPHEVRHTWAEIQLARLVAREADVVHVMSKATLTEASVYYELDPGRVAVIPHSNYSGQYPDWIRPSSAREKLGIHPHEKVLLALGGIRPYKGLDRLIDIFESMVEEDPSLRLLVAGRPAPSDAGEALVERCLSARRVVGRFEHLPVDQIQVWMRAADLAVLPYYQILNSGAFLLAHTFGLPIVAPRAGALTESADEEHVRLFLPDDNDSLERELRGALRDFVEDAEGAARARASALAASARLDPEKMAADFVAAAAPWLSTD
jgi:glycosyltransferase involved in cell wall biosynthesis